jgi:hypothetical protein
MRKALLIVLPVAVVGVIGGLVAIAARESDANFVFRQQHAATVEPRQVERAVTQAREPVPGNNGTRAVAGTCVAGTQGERRNPWTCRVRYASGRRVSYRIEIGPTGAWHGINPTGERLVRGCCIAVPTTQAG